jgi:hypothetical protein
VATDEQLRVGVVLDERDVHRWHETAMDEIERLGFCELVVLIREPGGRRSPGLRNALYRAYERMDRRVFGSDGDPIARVPLRRPGIPLGEISSQRLDVVLCLTPEADPGELAGHARLGAWALYAGGLRGCAGEAQLFWQMYDADFVAPITLRATTPTEGERTIYCSVVQSDHVSLHRSRCRAARRAAQLPARRLRTLHEREEVEELPAPDPGRPLPTNAMMVGLLWRVASGVLRRRVSGWLREKQWFIAYRRGSAPPTPIMPPPGRFYADPFLFQHDGRRYVFFEDYDWTSGRADICYLEIDEDGRHRPPQLALRQDCHLSYPFVFAEGDDVYMLPETAGHRTVELYRAAQFPGDWTLDRVLLSDVMATDATLLRHEGRWWLFVALALDGDRPIDELCLFSSDSLHGEWEPHPLNPIVSDVRSARPAGRIFSRDGQLIRPAQDCSEAYGGRLVFHRIDVLSPTEYREEPIGAIEPAVDSGNLRTHSYDSDGTYEVLDGFRMRPKLALAGRSRAAASPRWRRIDLEA